MWKVCLFFCFLFFISNPLFSSTQCNGTPLRPCIVEDTENNSTLKHWRSAEDLFHASQNKKINTKGLSSLWMSGSGEPSVFNWKDIAIAIIKLTNNQAEHLVDMDLRQESHGYLNQNAITLAAKEDWVNIGKSRETILHDENKWLKTIKKKKVLTHVLTPAEFKSGNYSKGKSIEVFSTSNEEKIAENARFKYERLTVADHKAPDDADVNRFLLIIKKLKRNTWIHFHCRGGDGRTTTFMAMYDMLHNADKVSLDAIIRRQASVAPFYNLFQTSRTNKLLDAYYKKRKVFLEKFYLYSKAHLEGYSGSWTDWLHENDAKNKRS